jgi:hypothetical protein
VDLLVEAVDSAHDKALIVAVASERLPGTPVVAASGVAGYGSPNDIITRHLMGDVWMVGDLVSEVSAEHPLFASRVAIAAGHQAHMVVRQAFVGQGLQGLRRSRMASRHQPHPQGRAQGCRAVRLRRHPSFVCKVRGGHGVGAAMAQSSSVRMGGLLRLIPNRTYKEWS